MEGRRFGIGVAVGLLFGLAIIAVAGGLGPAPFSSALANNTSHGGTVLAAVTANTTSNTVATTTVTQSTSSQPAYVAAGNLSLSTSTTSVTTSIPPSGNSSLSDLTSQAANAANSPAFSSRLDSIAHQPLVSDWLVFVPILVALLLGAVLYRASNRSREQPQE